MAGSIAAATCPDQSVAYRRNRPHLYICDLNWEHSGDHITYARTVDGRMTRRILYRWKNSRTR